MLAIPAGILLARQSKTVTLVDSSGAIVVAALLGWWAVILARRARERVQLTLGRSGGTGLARAGRLLGLAAILLAISAGLALGFWGLLSLSAS